jgi:NADH dehydrogenase (ubiquinone) Fe-S protein 1
MKSISFKLNDFQYTINNKLTLIQACLKNKVDVPRFCFHEKLSIAGNCRMCLVEDLKQVKPLASCAVNVSNSMNIYTNTVKVKKARESVLEFLLANHPLDCPICDQGGECDLQDQSVVFGSDRGRFYEFKRSVEDKDCGPLIKTIMNRCIHCTRCVRFSNEIAGVNILGITGRGSKMEIGFYIEKLMFSELSGNIIDLCPVGALTSKPFAFTSRPWELKSYNSIDILDSLHSNIRIDIRGTKIMRILPRTNSLINEDWITDKIRFSYDGFRRQRLYDPMIKISGNFLKISWKRSFIFLKSYFLNYLKASCSAITSFRGFAGEHLDIETIYMLKRFFSFNGSGLLFTLKNNTIGFDFSKYYSFSTPLSNLSESDICLLVDINLRVSLPLLNSRLRQLSSKRMLPIFILGFYSNYTYFVKHIANSQISTLSILEGSHWLSSKLSKKFSIKPLLFISSDSSFLNKPFIFYLLKNTNLFSANWAGLNIVPLSTSEFSFSELALGANAVDSSNNLHGIDFFFNFDKIKTFYKNSNSFKVYQGHHGDINASISNLILPTTAFIEKNSTYSNVLGIVQKTKKALFSPGNSRDDWKVLNALSEVFSFNLSKIDGSIDLISCISRITPFILYKRNFSKFYFSGLKDFIYFHNSSSKSVINNYYLSDNISRNSKIMSLCSVKFRGKSFNFF